LRLEIGKGEIAMRKLITAKSDLISIYDYHSITIILAVLLFLFLPGHGIAAKTVTYDGSIQGLNCVHYKQDCPEEDLDMYIALEHDFVLLLPDGRHFVLPNLDRGIKARYLAQDVRVRGKQEGTTVWVEQIQVKKGHIYKIVWDAEKQRKLEEAP
jgi:hypothetical protein